LGGGEGAGVNTVLPEHALHGLVIRYRGLRGRPFLPLPFLLLLLLFGEMS
jgi:hypothetical protein